MTIKTERPSASGTRRILVLGAGFVAGPLVRAHLGRPGIEVTVADLEPERAARLVAGKSGGRALGLDLSNETTLKEEIGRADIVVSLVPYAFHALIARLCLALGKDMVTTSYVSEAMRSFDEDARRAGLVFLNEVGLDPGLDHMEAMRVVHEVHGRGGLVKSFRSYCGGLPAPEANTNPFGYKFSWSPRGVLLAGRNSARYLRDGEEVLVQAGDLFDHYETVVVPGLGAFEGYPNRDSVPYLDLYGIPEARTMFRGTLRYPGWCETLKKIAEMGYLDLTEGDLAGLSCRGLTARLAGLPPGPGLEVALAEKLRFPTGSKVIERLAWLGLFDERPVARKKGSPLDVLEALMLDKLRYDPVERDMIVLRHEFLAAYPDGSLERIVSTLITHGIPGGDSAMALTVGLPAAAGVGLILDGNISRKGVLIPVHPEIYGPILEELASRGIVFRKERVEIPS